MIATYEHHVEPEIDPRTQRLRIDYDAASPWPVSTAIVLALSSITDIAPTEMRPLNNVVDVDGLNSHVEGRDRGSIVSFELHGYHVSVHADGTVTFTATDSTEAKQMS